MRLLQNKSRSSLGIVGFGAFGQLVARHLREWLDIYAFDPALTERGYDKARGALVTDIAEVARCQIVVLAPPVEQLRNAILAIRPHLRPGAIVLDVCSVKVAPARIMQSELPDDVELIGTHPLFGPQSARDGIAGLKIVLCPLRATSTPRIAAFLRSALGLEVFVTTPEKHDLEMASVQGLTHLIGKLLVQMEPLPTRMTTASYDLLVKSVAMIRHDNPALFRAIELANPFAMAVRDRFLDLAEQVRRSLNEPPPEKEMISQFTIRAATLGDYEELCSLWEILDEHHRLALPDRFHAPIGPRRERDDVKATISGPKSTILIATGQSHKLLGFVTIFQKQHAASPLKPERHFVEIDNMVVKPTARRKGVGRALIGASRDWTKERGLDAIELGVYAFNKAAIAFYASVGFEMSGHRMRVQL